MMRHGTIPMTASSHSTNGIARWAGACSCQCTAGIRAACLALAAMLLATSTVLGVEAGPDNPRKHYWLRNSDARVIEAGPMDARLREIADAFGRGEHERSRELAEALLDATNDPTLRGEAAAFLVQAYLAEGDFESARAAARRLEDQESLARVNRIEADYKAEVGRLQRIVATTKDPAEAARAQLLTARAHQRVGRGEVALESYWKVVGRHPDAPEAGDAIWWIAEIQWLRDGPDAAIAGCEEAIALAPDRHLGLRGCQAIFQLFIRSGEAGHEGMRERLEVLAARHADTVACYVAWLGIGYLHAAEGFLDRAEAVWVPMLNREAGLATEFAASTRRALAHLRYDRALAANSAGDRMESVRSMALVVKEPGWDGSLQGPLSLYALWCRDLAQHSSPDWYEETLWAFQQLAGLRAEGDARLNDRLEAALCLQALGRHEEAAGELRSILAAHPRSEALRAQCREALEESEEAMRTRAHTSDPGGPDESRPKGGSR
jgi:tetratricopeptide (TPR) repeat protein